MYGTGTRGTQVPVQVQVPVKTSNQFLKNNKKSIVGRVKNIFFQSQIDYMYRKRYKMIILLVF